MASGIPDILWAVWGSRDLRIPDCPWLLGERSLLSAPPVTFSPASPSTTELKGFLVEEV